MSKFKNSMSIISGLAMAFSSILVASAQSNAEDNSLAEIYFEMAELGRSLDGVDQDDLDNYLQACERDHALACRTAGYYLISGKQVQRDAQRGVSLYHKSCDLGDINGCLAASAVHRKGDGVPKDQSKAAAAEAKACELAKNTDQERMFC